jgi:hypothetical protein
MAQDRSLAGRWAPLGVRWQAAAFLALALLAAPARAAHPLVTDDAGTLGAGKRQLELTAEVGQDRSREGGVTVEEEAGSTAATLSLGLHDAADLVVAVPAGWSRVREGGALRSSEGGLGDLGVALKVRVLERGSFSLAVKPAVTLPTGDEARGLGSGAVSWGATLIGSLALGAASLHLDGGYTRARFGRAEDRAENRADLWSASLALVAQPLERLQLVADTGLSTNADRTSDTWPAFALGGVIYSVTDDLDVDAGVKAGISAPETDWTWLFGVATRF